MGGMCFVITQFEANWLFPSLEAFETAEGLLRVSQDTFMPYSVRDQVLNEV